VQAKGLKICAPSPATNSLKRWLADDFGFAQPPALRKIRK
jgi:hypothetical protein